MENMTARIAATQKTVDKWRGKPFKWGKVDCGLMAADHVKRFGHYPKIRKAGKWNSPLGAVKALKRIGFSNFEEMIDDLDLERINGAQAIEGDVALIEAEHDLGCICICTGPNQWLALHEDAEGFTFVEIMEFIGVWRLTWQKR